MCAAAMPLTESAPDGERRRKSRHGQRAIIGAVNRVPRRCAFYSTATSEGQPSKRSAKPKSERQRLQSATATAACLCNQVGRLAANRGRTILVGMQTGVSDKPDQRSVVAGSVVDARCTDYCADQRLRWQTVVDGHWRHGARQAFVESPNWCANGSRNRGCQRPTKASRRTASRWRSADAFSLALKSSSAPISPPAAAAALRVTLARDSAEAVPVGLVGCSYPITPAAEGALQQSIDADNWRHLRWKRLLLTHRRNWRNVTSCGRGTIAPFPQMRMSASGPITVQPDAWGSRSC